jgi:putrescine transport system substrate-binding protein
MTAIARTGTALAAAAGLLAGLAGTPAHAQDKTLNVYNWSDYIDEDTIPEFEDEYGIEVNYDVYSSNAVLEGKLMTGNTGYDIVVPTSSFFQKQIEAGIYQKLDKDKLDNWKHLDDRILERVAKFDPGNQYGVPYMWGTNGIGYNVNMVEERLGEDAPTDSWDLLLDPDVVSKLADCGVTILDGPTEVYPIVKHYLGIDPESEDPADLEKVEAHMKKIRPHVKYFHNAQYINDLANGDVCVSLGWSGDVYIAQSRAIEADQGVEIAYTIPKEGTVQWFDIMAIPADAPHPDAAHKWLNFNMRPKVAAQNTNYVWYPTANADADPYIDDEILNDPSIYPPEEVSEKLFVDVPNSAKYRRLRTRSWTSVKTGL